MFKLSGEFVTTFDTEGSKDGDPFRLLLFSIGLLFICDSTGEYCDKCLMLNMIISFSTVLLSQGRSGILQTLHSMLLRINCLQ